MAILAGRHHDRNDVVDNDDDDDDSDDDDDDHGGGPASIHPSAILHPSFHTPTDQAPDA